MKQIKFKEFHIMSETAIKKNESIKTITDLKILASKDRNYNNTIKQKKYILINNIPHKLVNMKLIPLKLKTS